jgi:hypothetical protein
MIDTHSSRVEIKVVLDPNGGHRVWVHVDGKLIARVYRAKLQLDGLALKLSGDTEREQH